MRNSGASLALVGAAWLLQAGCGETPTPTEPAPTSVEGTWSGTFDPGDVIDCSGKLPSRAAFQQVGEAVSGTVLVDGDCGFPQTTFTGTLRGGVLSGTLDAEQFPGGPVYLTGRFLGQRLVIEVSRECHFYYCPPSGTMTLRR